MLAFHRIEVGCDRTTPRLTADGSPFRAVLDPMLSDYAAGCKEFTHVLDVGDITVRPTDAQRQDLSRKVNERSVVLGALASLTAEVVPGLVDAECGPGTSNAWAPPTSTAAAPFSLAEDAARRIRSMWYVSEHKRLETSVWGVIKDVCIVSVNCAYAVVRF